MRTPRFELSKSKVLEQFNIVERLSDLVSYSSKTNPKVSAILEQNTASMFSLHSRNELKNIKDKSRVIFLAQGWNHQQISDLLEIGIRWFVVDNETDLNKILDFLSQDNTDQKISLLLRVTLKENTLKTEKHYLFGMKTNLIEKRIIEIRGNPIINQKLNSLGIHFHRKSQNISEWNLKFELENMFNESFFEKINFINIGGGIPSLYANTNLKVFTGIFRKIKDLQEWLNSKGIRMITEPGRFISAPAGRLITKIIGIHENTLIVNASVYNGDLDALIVPVRLLVEGEGSGKNYIIKGVTPCSMDIFRYRVYLPEKNIGDEIVFLNAGAYNFSSNFCDLDQVPTEVVE